MAARFRKPRENPWRVRGLSPKAVFRRWERERNSSLKQSQSKLPHRKGVRSLSHPSHTALGESPRTRHGFSRGMRKRAAIDASTPAAYSPAPSFSLLEGRPHRRLHSAYALLVLCCWSSLGRLACKGDEDMSPWPGNGGLALGSFWRREEEAMGSSW